MKRDIFIWRAMVWAVGFGVGVAAWGQSAEAPIHGVVRLFTGQQTVRVLEHAATASVLDRTVATLEREGESRILLKGARPGRTMLTYTMKDGTPVAEQLVVMPPLSSRALEIYGLVADIPGVHVYEAHERVVIDGRLSSNSDVERVKAITEALGDQVLNLTILDTGASNDVITDFIKRNAGVEGLTVSIFGDTAYLRGTVASEAVRTNVVALASTQIAKVMDMLTVQTGMIETEVLFLRVEKSRGQDWGMNLFNGQSGVLGLGGNVEGSQNYAENVWGAPQIAVSWSAALAPTIRALVSGGKAEVVARPRIGTRIGEKGRFLSGGEMYYKTSGEVSGDLDSVEYGIELTVAPQYLLDRRLCNDIRINLSFPVTQSGGADLSLDKYTIESTVVCEVGQSIVISGLTEHIRNEQNERTPILGDIPGVRLFFSNRKRTLKESELIAIITPRVMDGELDERRREGVSAGIQAERSRLRARDAQAAEQSLRAHKRAKALMEAGVARADAEAAEVERAATEEGVKARREAARERRKAAKMLRAEEARGLRVGGKGGEE